MCECVCVFEWKGLSCWAGMISVECAGTLFQCQYPSHRCTVSCGLHVTEHHQREPSVPPWSQWAQASPKLHQLGPEVLKPWCSRGPPLDAASGGVNLSATGGKLEGKERGGFFLGGGAGGWRRAWLSMAAGGSRGSGYVGKGYLQPSLWVRARGSHGVWPSSVSI